MQATIVLTRKTKIVLGVGSLVIAGAFFAAGLVTGLALWQPTQQDIVLAKAYRQKVAPRTAVAQVAAPPTAPEPVANPAATPSQPVAPPAPAAGSPVAPAMTANAAPAPAAAEPQAASPKPSPAPSGVIAASAVHVEEGEYTLQVGAFRDSKNAAQMVAELKERGYEARLFKAMDADLRMWYAVRLRAFRDLSSASRAAADFTDKEQIQALVRRASAL